MRPPRVGSLSLEPPTGLRYLPGFVAEGEGVELLSHLNKLDYGEVRMHGQVARRQVRHYGTSYDFDSASITPGEPIPDWITGFAPDVPSFSTAMPRSSPEALATRYPPGATIGWHRDAMGFGDVVGVSFGSPCRMRFQRGKGPERKVFEQHLEPLSAYVLTGSARWAWQHSIPAVPAERFSITFRTLHGHP